VGSIAAAGLVTAALCGVPHTAWAADEAVLTQEREQLSALATAEGDVAGDQTPGEDLGQTTPTNEAPDDGVQTDEPTDGDAQGQDGTIEDAPSNDEADETTGNDTTDDETTDSDTTDDGTTGDDVATDGQTVTDEASDQDAALDDGGIDAGTDDDPADTSEEAGQKQDDAAAAQDGAAAEKTITTQVTSGTKAKRLSGSAATLTKKSAPYDGKTFVLQAGGSSISKLVVQAYGKKGSKVLVKTYTGADAQKWTFVADTVNIGYYFIQRFGAQTVLGIEGGTAKSNANVVMAKKASGNAAKSQLWKVSRTGAFYRLISLLDSSYVLDLEGGKAKDGARLQIAQANSTKAQKFNLVNTNPTYNYGKTISEGAYVVKMKGNTNYAVDVNKASRATGANIQLAKVSGLASQRLYFAYDKKGFYTITDIATGKVLTVDGTSILPAINVVQGSTAKADTKKWAVRKNKNGSYTLINKATGLSLDLRNGKYATGTNLRAYRTMTTRAAQMFILEKTNLISEGTYAINAYKKLNFVLGIKGASNKSGGLLETQANNGKLSQRFQIVGNDKSGYRIRTGASGGWITSLGGEAQLIQKGKGATAKSKANTWMPVWNGSYFSLKNKADGSILSLFSTTPIKSGTVIGAEKATKKTNQYFFYTPKYDLVKAGLYVLTNTNGRALNVYEASKVAGTNVNTAKKVANKMAEKFVIRTVGNDLRIVSLHSQLSVGVDYANTANANVTQQRYTGAKTQLWRAQIGDGGRVVFVNVASLNSGNPVALGDTGADDGHNVESIALTYKGESAAAWRLSKSSGWANVDGITSYYNESGKRITSSAQAYELYNLIKNVSSATKYLIAVYPDKPRVLIFKGSRGNWVPFRDWACTTGAPGSDGKSITLRGMWLLGHSDGREEEDGEPLTRSAALYGKSVDLPGFSGATYGYLVVGRWAFHSTLPGIPVSQQLGTMQSHGCIRLAIANAKWLYNNMPRWTRVVSVPRNVSSSLALKLSRYGAWEEDQLY
jgi:lipoprotein-anchoring transpeptidase ErfK/SrfK